MTQASKGVEFDGHPDPKLNGVYRVASQHHGWPVLRNEHGRYCYRYEPTHEWHLGEKHSPYINDCIACVGAVRGPLPVERQQWRCYPRPQQQLQAET